MPAVPHRDHSQSLLAWGDHEESANFQHVLSGAGRRAVSHFASHSFIYDFYMIPGNFANAQSFGVSRPAGDQS